MRESYPGRLVVANGVDINVSTFGDPDDAAVLLIAGAAASMMSWDERFCAALAAHRRYIIRYDHRDTGRSRHYPLGVAAYDLGDLTADAAGVLEALGRTRTHVVGASMGGAIAQRLALQHPERVASLTLISSSPVAPHDPDPVLPPPSMAVLRELDDVAPADWSNRQSIVDYLTAMATIRAGAAGCRDGEALHRLVETAIDHGLTASAANHALVDYGEAWLAQLGRIDVPALVIHGALDPLVPVDHAIALVRGLRNARLIVLPDAGHDLDASDHERVVAAIHTHITSRR